MSEKKLGVIGGMGPLATQLFYKMVTEKTEAECDQEHIDMIILSHASMPDRTAAILQGEIDDVKEKLLKDAIFLAEAGVDYIAVTCNTAHHMIDFISEEVNVPFIHVIDSAVEKIKTIHPEGGRVGIFATDGTISTKLYQRRLEESGLEAVLPHGEEQQLVMSVIYDGVKKGGHIDIEGFMALGDKMKERGCCAVLMACTELSCIKEMYRLPEFYIDPMEATAEKAVILCGKNLRK